MYSMTVSGKRGFESGLSSRLCRIWVELILSGMSSVVDGSRRQREVQELFAISRKANKLNRLGQALYIPPLAKLMGLIASENPE